MKITKVTPRLIERAMEDYFWNPRTRWAKKQIVLVFVETHTACAASARAGPATARRAR